MEPIPVLCAVLCLGLFVGVEMEDGVPRVRALNKGQGTRKRLTEKAGAHPGVRGGTESSYGHPPPVPLCFTLFQKYLLWATS